MIITLCVIELDRYAGIPILQKIKLRIFLSKVSWRGARVVESGGLENRYTR